ncbi:MAG: hypothetical protein WC806_05695 [Candidatus Gracilibacteria bacterium]|jgi:hypothetical protein
MLFKEESDALKYLQDTVPQKVEKEVDTSRLYENLFDIPEELSLGHHEFEGKYGLKISFDLADASHSFGRCYSIYKNDTDVEGEYKPIYSIYNLIIHTNNFHYNISNHSSGTDIKWLPNLKNTKSELSHKFVDIGPRYMYLIGQDGYFARPIDLLGYFHELGHLETRSPDQLTEEYNTVKTTISSKGVKTEPLKNAAYELQRELDANDWMLKNTNKLFEDLEISPELIQDYICHLQLKSYYELNRNRILKVLNDQPNN